MATCFVALPLVVREVVPGARGDRRRPGAGRPQPRCQRLPGAPPDHPARPSSGRSCTASYSRWLAPSASSAPSRSSRGNLTGQTQTAPLVVEQKYHNFAQGEAYAVSFILVADQCPVHPRRLPVAPQGVHLMSIEIKNVNKRFGDFVALEDVNVVAAHRAADRSARPVRRRQVHAAADHRRPGEGRHRHRQHRRHRCDPDAAAEAQRRLRVPALRRVQAHDGGQERRVRPGDPQEVQGRGARTGRRAAEAGAPLAVRATGSRPSCPGASASGWRWPGRSPYSPRCCCSTSRSVPSTPRSARSCATGCAGSTTRCR